MTFRTRLGLAAALAVAVAVAAASAVVYVVVRGQLRGQVDSSLKARADSISRLPFPIRLIATGRPGRFFAEIPGPDFGGTAYYVQLVRSSGGIARPEDESDTTPLPISSDARDVAAGTRGGYFSDANVSNTHVRVITTPLANGWALQIARSLSEVDHSLSRIRLMLILVTLGGMGIAAALGLAVAQAALAPVRRLTEATEHVTETQDLSQRMDTHGRDELSRLAASFNTMLEALEQSLQSQRQLVADASHELRTPLTSLRTNIEVLARADAMPAEERERLLADVAEQLSEMSTLVAELVELARGEHPTDEPEEIRLDVLVAEAVDRAQRNSPQVEFTTDFDDSTVHGVRSTIERAIANLLDNAAKWSPSGGRVEVRVERGQVTVRDHGPGIDEQDLPFVFDRFYRAPKARGLPGSGLGLAIVRQVAESHGGEVSAERAEGGGTRMKLNLAPS
jgi:two-component system, OmpR family, sensor histidine kinase MprB